MFFQEGNVIPNGNRNTPRKPLHTRNFGQTEIQKSMFSYRNERCTINQYITNTFLGHFLLKTSRNKSKAVLKRGSKMNQGILRHQWFFPCYRTCFILPGYHIYWLCQHYWLRYWLYPMSVGSLLSNINTSIDYVITIDHVYWLFYPNSFLPILCLDLIKFVTIIAGNASDWFFQFSECSIVSGIRLYV